MNGITVEVFAIGSPTLTDAAPPPARQIHGITSDATSTARQYA
jgi:hypothetical protein